jgi:hypothetical protein
MITEEDRTIQTGIMAVAVNFDLGFGGEAETGVGNGDVDSLKESVVFSSVDI